MTRRTHAIVLILGLAYLVGVAAPCPPPSVSHSGEHGHAATRLLGPDGWCAASGSATSVSAVCPCGCEEKPVALGARVGVGLGFVCASAPLAPPAAGGLLRIDPQRAPAPPVRAIDHVPLPA